MKNVLVSSSLALATALTFSGCSHMPWSHNRQSTRATQPAEATTGAAGERTGTVVPITKHNVSNLEGLVGNDVDLNGKVDSVVTPNAFKVEIGGWLGHDVLVINPSQNVQSVNEGEQVRVRGRVETLDINRFNQQYGLSLNPSALSDYDGKPVVVATEIR